MRFHVANGSIKWSTICLPRKRRTPNTGQIRIVLKSAIPIEGPVPVDCSMAKAMARFCKAASMVPRCPGAEHAASRRGRIRIIALPTIEEVVVAVSMEPRRCGCARKHGRGREYQKSKFPCHDRGSSTLTSEEPMDQSAACSKRRIRRMRGCALTFAQISLAFRKERYVVWPMSGSGQNRKSQPDLVRVGSTAESGRRWTSRHVGFAQLTLGSCPYRRYRYRLINRRTGNR